jgi:hypothetical protein
MAGIEVTASAGGGAWIDLGSGAEIRDVVELDALEEADRIAALESIVLHFDHYGRLAAIEVTGAAGSVLPPGLVE